MIPFLHIGPLSIPTYGLMVAIGMLVAAYLLQFDFNRRRAQFLERGLMKNAEKKGLGDEAFFIIGVIGISGLIGARLYSVLENPRELFANPSVLISRYGFTWSGSFITTMVALVWLARHFDIPVLEFMDLCSTPAALGYSIGRLGCLLSGDGDYGVPTSLPWGMSFPNGIVPTMERVHPTPIYEFLGGVIISAYLWHLATKAANSGSSHGEIISAYLIWTGLARFLVEFIRINPKVLYGLTNAQIVSLVSMLVGGALLWWVKSRPPLKSETA